MATKETSAKTETLVSGYAAEDEKVGVKDGEFTGDVRYESTILVERKVDDEWVSVMTDRPRAGDRIPAKTMNRETGKLEQSTESTTAAGASRMPGKA